MKYLSIPNKFEKTFFKIVTGDCCLKIIHTFLTTFIIHFHVVDLNMLLLEIVYLFFFRLIEYLVIIYSMENINWIGFKYERL